MGRNECASGVHIRRGGRFQAATRREIVGRQKRGCRALQNGQVRSAGEGPLQRPGFSTRMTTTEGTPSSSVTTAAMRPSRNAGSGDKSICVAVVTLLT